MNEDVELVLEGAALPRIVVESALSGFKDRILRYLKPLPLPLRQKMMFYNIDVLVESQRLLIALLNIVIITY